MPDNTLRKLRENDVRNLSVKGYAYVRKLVERVEALESFIRAYQEAIHYEPEEARDHKIQCCWCGGVQKCGSFEHYQHNEDCPFKESE